MEQTGRSLSPAATQVALRSQWEAFQDRGAIVNGVRVGVHPVTGQVYNAALIGFIAPGTATGPTGMPIPLTGPCGTP